MNWLLRIVAAIVAGAFAWLICVFIGGLVATTNQPQLGFLGHFLVQYAGLIAVLVALWVLVSGWVPSLAVWNRPSQ